MAWKVSVEGASKVTILSKDGLPIARFYAGRFDPKLLRDMEAALNKGAA